ncbi:MAG: alpha/beta fold hydrolase [Rhizobiaceae bacterium]|nr:alpha/beta fold hydrolase [Rhizobiaceae bacterium]
MTQYTQNSHADGSPIVALHSSASSSNQWNKLLDMLGDRHELFAYNLPGYGEKAGEDNCRPGMATVAQNIIDRIEKIEEPIHLVGHSYGGAVAIKIALMRPDLVRSLNLYEPAVFHLLNIGNVFDQALLEPLKSVESNLRQMVEAGTAELGMAKFVDFWNSDGTFDSLPQPHREKIAGLASTVVNDFQHCFDDSWVIEDLAALSVPVQVLMGMESPTVAQRTSTLIYQNFTTAELVMLPGLGHMAPINASEWVNPRICQHIARIERSADKFSWPQKAAA